MRASRGSEEIGMAVGSTGIKEAFRACRGAFLLLLAFSFGTNILTLVSPLYMMQVFDRVLSSRSGDTLVMLTLVAGFALGFLALRDAVRSLMLAQIAEWLDDRLGAEVFAGALK